MKTIDGKMLATTIKANVKKEVSKMVDKKQQSPCLVCVLVGDNKASQIYIKSKQKACEECGIGSMVCKFPADIEKKVLVDYIKKLNKNRQVSGILLQLPLPDKLDKDRSEIINAIAPEKDVDCLTDENLGKLFASTGKIAPCTATGIVRILDSINCDVDGKDVVVVGRSLLVGKSVSTLLEQRNATVTNCHSHTQDLKEKCKKADVLIVAVGNPKMITKDYVKKGAVVIDVGINRVADGKIVGDVDFEDVKDKTSYITPVPGGVGPLTVACLMENTLIAEQTRDKSNKERYIKLNL